MLDEQTLYLLSLVAEVASQLFFVLFMWAELDGSVGHDPHHGGRVAPPEAEQPILHVRAVDESEGLLVCVCVRVGGVTNSMSISCNTTAEISQTDSEAPAKIDFISDKINNLIISIALLTSKDI